MHPFGGDKTSAEEKISARLIVETERLHSSRSWVTHRFKVYVCSKFSVEGRF